MKLLNVYMDGRIDRSLWLSYEDASDIVTAWGRRGGRDGLCRVTVTVQRDCKTSHWLIPLRLYVYFSTYKRNTLHRREKLTHCSVLRLTLSRIEPRMPPQQTDAIAADLMEPIDSCMIDPDSLPLTDIPCWNPKSRYLYPAECPPVSPAHPSQPGRERSGLAVWRWASHQNIHHGQT